MLWRNRIGSRLLGTVLVLSSAALVSCAETNSPLEVQLVANDTHKDNNGIALWWTDPDISVSYWVVERSTTFDGPWATIRVSLPSELVDDQKIPGYARFWDSGLPPGEVYYYRIFACTNEGRTGHSNVVDGTVPDFMPGLEPPVVETQVFSAPC